jgi:hypothetical protein
MWREYFARQGPVWYRQKKRGGVMSDFKTLLFGRERLWLVTFGRYLLVVAGFSFLIGLLLGLRGLERTGYIGLALGLPVLFWALRRPVECSVPVTDMQAFLEKLHEATKRTGLHLRAQADLPWPPSAATVTASLQLRLEFAPSESSRSGGRGIVVTLANPGTAVIAGLPGTLIAMRVISASPGAQYRLPVGFKLARPGPVPVARRIGVAFAAVVLAGVFAGLLYAGAVVSSLLAGALLGLLFVAGYSWLQRIRIAMGYVGFMFICAFAGQLVGYSAHHRVQPDDRVMPTAQTVARSSDSAEDGAAIRGADISYTATLTRDQAQKGTLLRLTIPGTKRTIKVHVPAGLENGQRLRLRGEGKPGLNGGSPGDFYIVLSIK